MILFLFLFRCGVELFLLECVSPSPLYPASFFFYRILNLVVAKELGRFKMTTTRSGAQGVVVNFLQTFSFMF